MNQWVEEKTHNKIKDLINKDDLDEDTRAILINAMYFHGKWVNEFPVDATRPIAFYPDKDTEIHVDTMEHVANFNYYECSKLKAEFIELPYEGSDITMTIALPSDMGDLSILEAHMSDVLAEHTKYVRQLVEIRLPKFQIKSSIEFKPIMEALGIVEAFSNHANFQEIIEDEQLKISKVVQKTFIEVGEKGTVASVATAVEAVSRDSDIIPPPTVTEFHADHPFIYYIKIKGIVFFVGRYTGV